MKRYWKKDKVKDLKKKELNNLIHFLYDFCKSELGYNNRKRTHLTCELDYEPSNYYGWYDPNINQIVISIKNCKSIGQLVTTFIHEYTHSTQPCLTKYNKLLKRHGYKNHPFEIQAGDNEIIYTNRALREFRKTL